MDRIPRVSQDLLEYLEKICPDHAPRMSDSEREVWFKAGKADLVGHLRSIFNEQNETILEGN